MFCTLPSPLLLWPIYIYLTASDNPIVPSEDGADACCIYFAGSGTGGRSHSCDSEKHPALQAIDLDSWASMGGEPHGELNKPTIEDSLDTGMEKSFPYD